MLAFAPVDAAMEGAVTAAGLDHLSAWIGRSEEAQDEIRAWPVRALAAMLDRDDDPRAGDPLPPGYHWLYFLEAPRLAALGKDGHAARGGFLPPVPLPRRMWAGGELIFHAPLRIGEPVRRVSTVCDIAAKRGRSGALVFVTVHHAIHGPAGLTLEETHDIVYRADARPGARVEPRRPAQAPHFRRQIVPTSTLLFRYSALTFNGHRIHYDLDYCREVEGYPGLVVHGPLIATLLLDLLRRERHDAGLARFRYRATAPLLHGRPMGLCGRPEGAAVHLWAEGAEGELAMEAEAELIPATSRAARNTMG